MLEFGLTGVEYCRKLVAGWRLCLPIEVFDEELVHSLPIFQLSFGTLCVFGFYNIAFRTLGIQVCKSYLLWGLKYIKTTCVGLF